MPSDNGPQPNSPTVKINGSALADAAESMLTEAVADLDSVRPSMFVLRFVQSGAPGDDLSNNFKIGDEVTIGEKESSKTLITAEVTSIEADFGSGGQGVVVRGYDKTHRLHRTRKNQTFENKTDSDIVGTLA